MMLLGIGTLVSYIIWGCRTGPDRQMTWTDMGKSFLLMFGAASVTGEFLRSQGISKDSGAGFLYQILGLVVVSFVCMIIVFVYQKRRLIGKT